MIFLPATRGRVPSYLGCSLSFVDLKGQGPLLYEGTSSYDDAKS